MQQFSPLSLYQQALSAGKYQPDDAQLQAVSELDVIYHNLKASQTRSVTQPINLTAKIKGWLKRPQEATVTPVKGLYMWGGVGRGKTWLMDMFYASLPGERKLRLHFHRFMLRVHEELTRLQGQVNPLEIVADDFKKQTDILCFDEFFVSDITDAMLLGTLMEALFSRGITLVTTSNIPPDQLYRNGLQRARFLPAIALIKEHCTILNVDAGIDYRLRTLTRANLFLTPVNADAEGQMLTMFKQLTGGKEGSGVKTLEINHHPMTIYNEADGVLVVDFKTLCEEARSQIDYIALARLYHTVFLCNVKQMGKKPEQENAARRFLALIDEFYERRVKLIISAEVVLEALYEGELLAFEYQRCMSRLQEMQSHDYLALPHLP